MEHGGRTVAVLIRIVAETGSTNEDLAAVAAKGLPEGSWLCAERQSAGRGRQGRAWVSPVGNLYASTLVRRRLNDPPVPSLALVAAVALHEAVSVFLDTRDDGALTIKWPNDLLLGGAKLSGILLEGAGDATVVGFGVNVAHHPDLPDRPTTSLASRGVAVSPQALLEVLAEGFARWLGVWRGQGLEPVRSVWLARAHPIGSALSVQPPSGVRLDGLFDGLDRGGALLLRLAGGERRVIHAADVFLL